jgi:hypothetical protein
MSFDVLPARPFAPLVNPHRNVINSAMSSGRVPSRLLQASFPPHA